MAFFNLFKPKWQHSDPKIRLKAVVDLPEIDLPTLMQIVVGDTDSEVRRAAGNRINDWHLLLELSTPDKDQAIISELAARIDFLQLSELFAAQGVEAKLKALAVINKESLLARIAEEETEADIRLQAVERIANQEILTDVVTKNCGKAPALLAVEKITDEPLLRQVAANAASRSARARAQQKIDAIEEERNRPTPEALREMELVDIMAQAQRLNESTNLGLALDECRKLQGRLTEIAEPGDQRSLDIGKCCDLIQSKKEEEEAREEAKREAQRVREQRLERLKQIPAEINILAKGVSGEEEARVSTLLQEWSALLAALESPCPDDLLQQFNEASEAFTRSRTLIAHESAEEANLLKALAAIPSFIEADDLEQALGSLTEAQRSFYGWQPQIVDRQKVTERLGLLRDQHRAAAARREEARSEILQANLVKKNELLLEMKDQLTIEDIKQAEQRIKEIKESWKKLVDLPTEAEDLQPQYAETSRLFAERLAVARKEETWQRWQNKNLKEQLVGEAEALDEATDLRQIFKRIKELQENWKAIGPAPAKEENPLWRRFQQATERNFARCRVYFQELDEEAERNLEAKIRLRDLAIEHQESTEWQKNADFIKELQAQWKAVGRGPKDKEEEIFQSFRAACDHFFERRKAHHAALDQERQVNFGLKEALCVQAEALADQPEPTHKLKFQELQTAWKAIGQASRDQEVAIWQRFRAACNRYYEWLDSLRPENLAQKEALCVAVEELTAAITPDTNFLQVAKKVVALQRQWKEIGPVPKEQQDAVWERFKSQCDAFYAAKKEHDDAVDRQRPENQAKKEAILARIKELSVAKVSRESVKEIIAIQEEWHRIGPAEKEKERSLQDGFKALCDSFFKERREALQEIDKIHQENLKKKETLCLRLEILAGINPHPVSQGQGKKGGLTLAEQLKVAFETNFVLSADDARDKKKLAKDEIESVKAEWQKIGAIPREHENGIRKRYTAALEGALKA